MDNFKSAKGSSSLVPLVGSFQLFQTEIPRAYPGWNSFVFFELGIPVSDLFFQILFGLPKLQSDMFKNDNKIRITWGFVRCFRNLEDQIGMYDIQRHKERHVKGVKRQNSEAKHNFFFFFCAWVLMFHFNFKDFVRRNISLTTMEI
ncbi:hypothetical protein C2G38_2036755 [Gigaspora rosea]|uniref:Uncharacterized protein n=1 Tax=Gigaspora rosea TaxID=44941 RepID=A0A397V9K5_9GLOM|nr:hypothetical protein C2G38_2036755 [Gigaspora rosea]